MRKRYFIYHESRTIIRGITRYDSQPKDGYDYEYQAEKAVQIIIEGGGSDAIRNFTIIKMYTQIND